MSFKAWLKENNPNIPECGSNYMILQQLWYSRQTQAIVDQDQVNDTLKSMEEFRARKESDSK